MVQHFHKHYARHNIHEPLNLAKWFHHSYRVQCKTPIADKIWNLCLTAPITRFTWILTFASFLVASTAAGDSWSQPLVNAGKSKVAPTSARLSVIVNLQSANTISPCVRFLKYLLCSVICLSNARPPHPFEIKLIDPSAVMLIKYFAVL